MTAKVEIVERLGHAAVLLPDLIAAALAANDRAKLRMTLLQDAEAHAARPDSQPHDLMAERRAAGLDDPAFDATVSGATSAGEGQLMVPGAERLAKGLHEDIDQMIVAVRAAEPAGAEAFADRLKALAITAPPVGDLLPTAAIGAMTSARRGDHDSEHLLVMDLHKAINAIAASTATEIVDGAHAHRLTPQDRPRLQAFMRGLNRTAPLAFGHPGLGTTAVRIGERLTIQNDIGVTDAHVIVIHVQSLAVDITYTDVHRGRTRFFTGLFEDHGVDWSPLSERSEAGLADDQAFFLVTGRHQASDLAGLDAFLEYLGSRLVFLIDWNKARKALEPFVGKRAALRLLSRAAARDQGHRAFLELGGAELVLDAVRHVAAGQALYGARLDEVLGEREAREFLADVLRIASEGLSAGRSTRLIRDEMQANLALRLQSAQAVFLTVALRHLGLSRMLVDGIRDALANGRLAPAAERTALAAQASRLEQKGDRLTLEAREIAGRLTGSAVHMGRVIDEAEEALDAFDEAAFLFCLLPGPPADTELVKALSALAEVAVDCTAQMVRACEAASRAPTGWRQDATEALQAIDAVRAAERAADAAERRMIQVLMRSPAKDARVPVVGMELAHAIERATDHLAHAALALRDHVIEELAL